MISSFLKLLAQVTSGDLPLSNFDTSITEIVKIVLMIAAMLAVVFVAYGGFKYTTSNGDPQGIKSAKDTILAAIVGLVIAVSAFMLVNFVGSRL